MHAITPVLFVAVAGVKRSCKLYMYVGCKMQCPVAPVFFSSLFYSCVQLNDLPVCFKTYDGTPLTHTHAALSHTHTDAHTHTHTHMHTHGSNAASEQTHSQTIHHNYFQPRRYACERQQKMVCF